MLLAIDKICKQKYQDKWKLKKIHILNTIDRSSALVEQKWSPMSLLHMKINSIIEKGAGHFFLLNKAFA